MMNKYLLLFLIVISTTPSVAQQQLEELFQINASPSHPWFNADDSTRGLAVNPRGNVLVVDRNPIDTIYRLDPFSGQQKGELKTSTINGGAFKVNKVCVTTSGRIFVSNLSTGNNPFKIYYYYDELSDPVVVYDDPAPGKRWGDDLAVIGSGTGIQLLVTGSENPDILVLNDFDGDGKYASRVITPINPPMKGTNNISFDLDQQNFWIRQSTAASAATFQYTLNEGIGNKSSFNSVQGVGPMDIAIFGRQVMMALGPGIVKDSNLNENRAYVMDLNLSTQPQYQSGLLVNSTGGNPNINGSGDVVISPANSTLHVLYTNNSISGWRIPKN